jgi:hypothetical protein
LRRVAHVSLTLAASTVIAALPLVSLAGSVSSRHDSLLLLFSSRFPPCLSVAGLVASYRWGRGRVKA